MQSYECLILNERSGGRLDTNCPRTAGSSSIPKTDKSKLFVNDTQMSLYGRQVLRIGAVDGGDLRCGRVVLLSAMLRTATREVEEGPSA